MYHVLVVDIATGTLKVAKMMWCCKSVQNQWVGAGGRCEAEIQHVHVIYIAKASDIDTFYHAYEWWLLSRESDSHPPPPIPMKPCFVHVHAAGCISIKISWHTCTCMPTLYASQKLSSFGKQFHVVVCVAYTTTCNFSLNTCMENIQTHQHACYTQV